MPDRKDFRVLGISDHDQYAATLAKKFDYVNTFFHREPRLDICSRNECLQYSGQDCTICTDVLEHTIARPPQVLGNLAATLKPNGFLVISAPTFAMPDTIEWYGGITDFDVKVTGGHAFVVWMNLRGQLFVDYEPVFHGGPGTTLELRAIAHADLTRAAERLGLPWRTVAFDRHWGYDWPLIPTDPHIAAAVDGRVIVMGGSK